MDKKKLYGLIDEYWKEYKDKTENKPDNRLENGEYISKFIRGPIPIVWFGDYDAYINSNLKVVTVGMNPSDKEFLKGEDENNCFRFPVAKGLNDIKNDDDRDKLIVAYNGYFINDPLTNWFEKGFGNVLKCFPENYSVSYGYNENNTYFRDTKCKALHIDCYSALATNPTWSNLKRKREHKVVTEILEEKGKELYELFIETLAPDVIVFQQNIDMVKFITGEAIEPQHRFKKEDDSSKRVGSYIKNKRLYIWGEVTFNTPWQWLSEKNLEHKKQIANIINGFVR